MEFDPVIHTKEFLIGNVDIAFKLAKNSAEFAVNSRANGTEILNLEVYRSHTVAHYLASNQPQWLRSDAAKNTDI